MRTILFIILLALTSFTKGPDQNGDALLGTWMPETGRAKISIYKAKDRYFGKIIWLKEPEINGKAQTDHKNPDPSLRNRPLLGPHILRDFVYAGDKVWEDGKINDPNNGKEYSCNIKMSANGTLDVRGYIGISLIGRSQVWTRVK